MKLITYEKHNDFIMEMCSYEGTSLNNEFAINNRFAIVLIETGAGILTINNKSYTFIAPAILCINEKEHVIIDENLGCNIKVIYFHPKIINCVFDFENIRNHPDNFNVTLIQDAYLTKYFIERTDNFNGIIPLGPLTYKRCDGIIQYFKNESTLQTTNFWPCRSRSFLLEILYLIDNVYLDNSVITNNSLSHEIDDDLYEILIYLYNNYNKKITITDLTKEFSINRTTLTEKFNKYTGDSIIVYLNKLRIKMASIFLRDTKIPIYEVMERVGFNDSAHFLRTFKKYMNFSPKEYRDTYCWIN